MLNILALLFTFICKKHMYILVLNGWSSSLKFSVFNSVWNDEKLWGAINNIWEVNSEIAIVEWEQSSRNVTEVVNHKQALWRIYSILEEKWFIFENDWIHAVWHRVVHWGDFFSKPVIIDNNVKDKIEECSIIASLHNPINLLCIEWAQELFGEVPHVAVFDTAFHQTLPESNYLYAIPKKYYKKYKIRKYWFHGISHQFVSERLTEIVWKQFENVITCHIWNWASLSAIKNWKCINTSMWFTPVDGLVMWTRAGDIDPWVVLFLQEKEELSANELRHLINRESWMLWLTWWMSWNLKDVEEWIKSWDTQFELALEIYISRIVRFIWAYIADLGWLDAIVFTAWVLENSPSIRKKIAERLAFCWVVFDQDKNDFRWEEQVITTQYSPVELFVLPTNEELMIKREVEALLH